MKKLKKNKKGFTIIEIIVSIGLIFLISTITIITLIKKDDEEKLDKNIENAYMVYLEGNSYYNSVLEQEREVYINFNKLVENGLVDKKIYTSYENKCFKLYYASTQNIIELKEETNKNLCDKTIILKEKPIMIVTIESEKNVTNTCYKKLKLNIEVKPNDNKIEKLSVKYKINNVEKEDVIVSNKEINEYTNSYTVKNNASDIKVVLKTDYNNEDITKIFSELPETIIYDKYSASNSNIIKLENHQLKKISGTNNIATLKSNGVETTLDSIKDYMSIQTLNIEDECGHTYNYTIDRDYTYKDYVKFTDIDVNYWGSDYQYYYRFSDGSILYNYYVSSCRNDDYWCYNNSLKIYNPITKKEFILYSSYNSSNDEIKHNIKVSKINETKYRINVETDYSQPKNGQAYKYYEEYEYDITKDIKEDAIKENYRVYKVVGASEVYSTKKHYCEYSYQFHFLVPSLSSSKKYYEEDHKVSFGSSAEDFCIGRSKIIDSFDEENSKYMTYKNDFINTISNSISDDYDKVIDKNNSKLMTAIDNYATKSNTGQRINGTYNSSSLHSFIRNKVWENDELIVVPFACRLDSDEDYSECFLKLNKSLTLNLISTN